MELPITDDLIINGETLPVITQLAERIPGGFFIYRADGMEELIYFNSHLAAIFGCENAEEFKALTGNCFRGLVHPDDYAASKGSIEEQIRSDTHRIDHIKYRFIRKDGSVGMLDDYGHFSRSEAFGDVFYVFVQDITKEYLEEQKARQLELLNSTLMDYEGVFLIDCENDTRRTFHDRLSGAARYDDAVNYSALFAGYVENCVCAPDKELMEGFIEPANMLKLLGGRKELSVTYRDKTTGTQRFYEMKIIRYSDTEVLQSFRETDTETVNALLLEKLRGNYVALFGVDLESGLIRSYKEDPMKIVGGEGNVTELSAAMKTLASYFDGETRDFFERLSETAYIKEKFAKEDRAEYIYRSVNDDDRRWLKATGTVLQRKANGEPSLFCMGFSYLDNEASELQSVQEELNTEAQRSELFFDTFNAGKWAYEISAADEVVSARYSDAVYRNTNIPSYSGQAMGWIERVHPDDRERTLKAFMAPVYDHTGKTKYDVDFRIVDDEGRVRWTKSAGRVIRREDGTGEYFGMNIDITDEVREQEQLQAQKAEADQFISSFIRDYGAVFKVSREDDSFQMLKNNDSMRTRELMFNRFSQAMDYLLEHIVYEPDRDRVRREISRENVLYMLSKKPTYSIEYRVPINGITRWDKMTFSVLDETYAAVGFAVKNREIILSRLQDREYENYYALFSIDLDAEQITMLKNDSGYATGTVGSTAPYREVMTAFACSLEGKAKDFFLKFSDIEQVKAIHAVENKLTYVYKSVLDKEERWVRATSYAVIRHEDGSPAVATLGFNFMDSMGADRQEMQENLARLTAVSNYFIKSYSSACYCDMRTGDVVILQSNPMLEKAVAQQKVTYEGLCDSYISGFVHPEDRETVRRRLGTDYIRRKLETADDLSFNFRVVSKNGQSIYRCTVIRGADSDHVGIGFRNVSEEVQKEQELERTDSLIRTFASEYEAVFITDLKDGSYRTVTGKKELSTLFDGKGSFQAALDRYTDEMMHPMDRERAMHERIEIDKIANILPVGEKHSVEFRSRSEGVYAWCRGTVTRISEDRIMIGFKNIDEEKIFSIIEDTIIGEFDALYLVDLDRDEIRPVRASRISSVGSFTGKLVYSELCRKFAGTVAPKYKQDWLRFGNTAFMKRYMAKLDKREYIYELPEAGSSSMRRLTASVIERVNGEASVLLLSFTGIDDLRAQSILMERKMAEQNAFTQYFLEPYESAYYIGLNDLSWQAYKRTEKLENDYPVYENYIESLGKYIRSEVHPEDRGALRILIDPERLRERLALQPSFSFTYRKLSEAEVRIFRCEVIRGADEDHVAFEFRDITEEVAEQERRQFQLREALEQAQAASKAKTEFLFNMSHDIRTPMNAIIGFTNMAMKHIDDKARVQDSLAKTQEAGEMLLSLINDILDMSRIESGKITLEENEGDVFLSFANIEATMQELAKTKNIDLSFTVENITDRYIYADFSRCIRIFVNIITNAIKYTNPGGFVRVRCEQAGAKDGFGYYRYTFTDNGIGMSKEFQKHVFDEFTREETATVSGIQGTGLGLAVCRTFVNAMNGTIECSSTQGVGSTFTVVLPFRIQEGSMYTHPVTGKPVSGAAAEVKTEKTGLAGRRVLVVEDNEMNREIAEDILSEEGMLVETASDGSVAVGIMKEKGPDYYDFILMDIQMPIMDGYEATKAIRAMYPKAGIPIIALSANAFEEDKIASLTAGMNDHVAKPIDIKILKSTLARFL